MCVCEQVKYVGENFEKRKEQQRPRLSQLYTHTPKQCLQHYTHTYAHLPELAEGPHSDGYLSCTKPLHFGRQSSQIHTHTHTHPSLLRALTAMATSPAQGHCILAARAVRFTHAYSHLSLLRAHTAMATSPARSHCTLAARAVRASCIQCKPGSQRRVAKTHRDSATVRALKPCKKRGGSGRGRGWCKKKGQGRVG